MYKKSHEAMLFLPSVYTQLARKSFASKSAKMGT